MDNVNELVLKKLSNIEELLSWLIFQVDVLSGSEELYQYFFNGYKCFYSTDILVLSLEKICNQTLSQPCAYRSPYKFNRFLTFWITRFPASDWRTKAILATILDIAKISMPADEFNTFKMLCLKDARRAYARNVNVAPSHHRRTSSFITFGQTEGPDGERRNTTLQKILNARPKTHSPHDPQKEWRILSEEQLAQQLTLIDHELYCTVQPEEFLKRSWNSPLRDVLAPHLKVLVKRFNEVSFWVATQILMSPSPKLQAKMIKKFIRLAEKLYELHNFNGLMQIMSGLHNNSVLRLKRAWSTLKVPMFEIFTQLSDVMSFTQNFQKYREIMIDVMTTRTRAIPYIVLFMRDITFIEENPNITAEGQMNYAKLMRVGKQLAWFKHFADLAYEFPIDMQVQKLLQDLKALPEDELHHLSLLCEPREGDENSAGEKKSLAFEFLRTWTLLPKKEQ